MLKQISLELGFDNRFQAVARENGLKLEVVDCKSFNAAGMSLLIRFRGDQTSVRNAVAQLSKEEYVREVVVGEAAGEEVPLLVLWTDSLSAASHATPR